MSERKELQPQPSTDKRREEIARIARQTFEGALKETYPCQRCAGHGFHHGFGEDGCDPDWCADCGGSGFNGPTDDEAWLKAVDAIMALPPLEDGWRDIASAPKDGVPFWAYQPGREQFVCWEQDTRDGVVWMDEIDSEPEPTHWRPLPAPPSNPETKGDA